MLKILTFYQYDYFPISKLKIKHPYFAQVLGIVAPYQAAVRYKMGQIFLRLVEILWLCLVNFSIAFSRARIHRDLDPG